MTYYTKDWPPLLNNHTQSRSQWTVVSCILLHFYKYNENSVWSFVTVNIIFTVNSQKSTLLTTGNNMCVNVVSALSVFL